MSANSWSPIWQGILDSSIWEEPDHVLRVFVALLSLKGMDDVVQFDDYKLARRIHMDLDMPRFLDALRILASPDLKRPGQEFEGRRIEKVDGGWKLLNGEKYREMMKLENKRARDRRAQAMARQRKKQPQNVPGAREQQYDKAVADGNDALAERIMDGVNQTDEGAKE